MTTEREQFIVGDLEPLTLAEAEGASQSERLDALPASASEGADAWTCAICLDAIQAENLAVVKGCEHTYCVQCILKWSCVKETDPCCPTCKAPFTSLLVHRCLDGTLTDYEIEESVVLLARAKWFQEWLKAHDKVTDLYKYIMFRSTSAAEIDVPADAVARAEWEEDALYQIFEDDYDDEDVEDYYFSAQAGASRVTFGNRPFGPNGFVRSGHRCARPTASTAHPSKGAGKGRSNHASSNSVPGRSGAGASLGQAARNEASASSSKGPGRRARRNARRNATDERL